MFELSPDEQRLLPSDDDVEFYQQHGWFVTPRLFTDEAVDAASAALADHHKGKRDSALPIALDEMDDWIEGSVHETRFNDHVALTNSRLGSFMLQPIIAAIAARLAQTGQIRLWLSSLIYKPPHTKVTLEWHSDRVHWHTCTSTNMLTAWIALQDCDESMGPVVMIDGSHRWPDTDAVRAVRYNDTFFRGPDPARADSLLESIGMPIRRVPLLLRKGQVSFHHCMTIHGSGSNLSDRARVGLIVHMQDNANRYQRAYDDTGKLRSHVNDQMCGRLTNGDVDYRDPKICPVLWDTTESTRSVNP
ncbi:phytanoyl-CoA dioxygenase family protein [Nocardia cyriacigeorgica]|uniref:phytanoyl-CoA dioxygenase family protein n=1 Tax=Nocardia cyriacigeorgica TaxID=135487 RepID=UPI001895F5AB|nr:phytanoyl-CoA dioxygenase family protein [Nocardia cyriacigeorgica]MBF6416327.1 phytanoyl-CoA dioxygenase family protein [Nocardia cyriacigeorgica]